MFEERVSAGLLIQNYLQGEGKQQVPTEYLPGRDYVPTEC